MKFIILISGDVRCSKILIVRAFIIMILTYSAIENKTKGLTFSTLNPDSDSLSVKSNIRFC